jgi:aldose 1-epimerase
VRVVDGRGRHRLEAADGRAVELWTDENFGYVEVYIRPRFPHIEGAGHPARVGSAVAIEPMTAPPDAFNSGLGLRWLAPGETWEGLLGGQSARERRQSSPINLTREGQGA